MTDSERTETQAEILDRIESDPSATNADIAEQTGTHVALVRDLRADHAGDDEAEDDGSGDDGGLSEPELGILEAAASDPSATNADIAVEVGKHVALVRDFRRDTQTAILETVLRNPSATNADIAEETGSHVALVRDTRAEYEDDIAGLDVEVADSSADDGPTASADSSGLSNEKIIAILVGILLLIGVAAAAL